MYAHENGIADAIGQPMRDVQAKQTCRHSAVIKVAMAMARSNRVRNSIFVSIHFNEGARPVASGVETYYANRQSLPLPRLISWIPFLSPQASSDSPNIESQSLAVSFNGHLVAKRKRWIGARKGGSSLSSRT